MPDLINHRPRRSEFTVWTVTRADVVKFIMYEMVLSSAIYAGLKRMNGHELIAILGSSVSTTLCKQGINRGYFTRWIPRHELQVVPWHK